eukprot:gb/GEZJ01004172.1/.p1 GENE.gb/GEZJ01004172.1/~~gb/GEZJ01004172.1/.p1  ORF type:complete len:237 (+),score=24.19 gb/GEZJ01004172.1/:2769-3479(+)
MGAAEASLNRYYCIEHKRGRCRTVDGFIGSSPSHFCLVCKHPIHSIWGTLPEESVRNKYAPDASKEGSGASVLCTACDSKLNEETGSHEIAGATQQYRFLEGVLPKHVQSFRYTVNQEQPVKRLFVDSLHIVCEPGSNPVMEAEETPRTRLIIPRVRSKSFCEDSNLKIEKRAKNAAEARRYRQRHRKRINQSAQSRYEERRKQASKDNGRQSTSYPPKDSEDSYADSKPFGSQCG